MELTFTPATITYNGHSGAFNKALDALGAEGFEWDRDANHRLLIGVPAGHDTVFTVGPYTITLDV